MDPAHKDGKAKPALLSHAVDTPGYITGTRAYLGEACGVCSGGGSQGSPPHGRCPHGGSRGKVCTYKACKIKLGPPSGGIDLTVQGLSRQNLSLPCPKRPVRTKTPRRRPLRVLQQNEFAADPPDVPQAYPTHGKMQNWTNLGAKYPELG